MKKLQQSVSKIDTSMLKDYAIQLKDNFSDEGDLVWSAILDELQLRLPSVEFITFCENL